jgi:hypothetical protein
VNFLVKDAEQDSTFMGLFQIRWRQEEKAKKEAVLQADNEKRLREQADAAAKRKEESMRMKAEADKLRHRDDIHVAINDQHM